MASILNWGLIGAGDIARKRIAPALRDLPNCELISVSRSQADRAEEFAREFGVKKWFADWREQISDDEISAVYIATPVYLHAAQTIAAAEAGKHILCEKPMALNLAECDKMLAVCRANNVTFGIAYYRRFYPVIERIKELLAAKTIGQTVVVQMNAFEYFDPPKNHPRHWLIEKEKSGGGPMIDFGCHRLEVLTNLCGALENIKSIRSNKVFGRGVEDTATALLQFETGTVGVLTVSHAVAEPQDSLDIFGTEGSIHIPILNRGELHLRLGNVETVEVHPPAINFHQPLIENFTNAVLDGIEPEITGETGREISHIVEEIYRGVV